MATKIKVSKKAVLGVLGLLIPSLLLAEPSIKVQVQVRGSAKHEVMAVGFSVNDSRSGSLGTLTTKRGPAGATYSFGVRTSAGRSVGCGDEVLAQNSVVIVTFDGNTCTSSVSPMDRR